MGSAVSRQSPKMRDRLQTPVRQKQKAQRVLHLGFPAGSIYWDLLGYVVIFMFHKTKPTEDHLPRAPKPLRSRVI